MRGLRSATQPAWGTPGSRASGASAGLTLIELILAVLLLALVAGVCYFSFDSGAKAWRAGTELADSLHHADYVLEQLVMGLRSAYYPDANRPAGAYGFTLADGGDGEAARDTISWVKLGTALVGADAPYAGTPHRVVVTAAEPDEELSGGGFSVKAWRIDAQAEGFDPERDVERFILTSRVVGFNCRVLDPKTNLAEGDAPDAEEEPKWLDEWEGDYTNRLPYAVEISLYLEPPSQGAPPLTVQRIVELPLAPLSWRDKMPGGGGSSAGSASSTRSTGESTDDLKKKLEQERTAPVPGVQP